MKTITMDWETYQKEIASTEEHYERGFNEGAKENQKRLEPILDFLRDTLKRDLHVFNGAFLWQLMKDAGE